MIQRTFLHSQEMISGLMTFSAMIMETNSVHDSADPNAGLLRAGLFFDYNDKCEKNMHKNFSQYDEYSNFFCAKRRK